VFCAGSPQLITVTNAQAKSALTMQHTPSVRQNHKEAESSQVETSSFDLNA
jgi:hypothetical protein